MCDHCQLCLIQLTDFMKLKRTLISLFETIKLWLHLSASKLAPIAGAKITSTGAGHHNPGTWIVKTV